MKKRGIYIAAGLALVAAGYLYLDWRSSRSLAELQPRPVAETDSGADRDLAYDVAEVADTGIPPEAWPASWFENPRTASQLGIERFTQSPMLDARVASGELPPLEERLPLDPIVIEPYEEIGVHGGTARIFEYDLQTFIPEEAPYKVGPEMRRTLHNLAEETWFSADARAFTIRLRSGLRWSDGHPFTADDFIFWLEEVQFNEDLTPVPWPLFRDVHIEKIDDRTFTYHFPQPWPLFRNSLAHNGITYFMPKHFLSRFHVDYRDRRELEREASRHGFRDWRDYFFAANDIFDRTDLGRPVMRPYVRVRVSANRMAWERNPFYPKVDPAGQQLPYIDRIQAQLVQNREVAVGRASTGQVSFAGQNMQTGDIPLFKRFEADNDYETYVWHRLHGVDVAVQFNMNHRDEELRGIFQDFRFRKALSLALNRDEINRILYFGMAVPRQVTVAPSSRFFETEFAEAYIEHDPRRARELLDEIGLVDRNGDGLRELPSGRPWNVTLEYVDIETPKEKTLELASAYWREVGLRINIRQIDGSLQGARAIAGLMDMTIWHADRSSDILFPLEPYWFVPMHEGWELGMWSQWAGWLRSDGTRGWPPPEDIRELHRAWNRLRHSPDEDERVELGKWILRRQAENLWTVGTVGLAPHPLVIHNSLGNVPRQGYWGWDNKWTAPYFPETWFLRPDQ